MQRERRGSHLLGNHVLGSGFPKPAQHHLARSGMELDLPPRVTSQTCCDDLETLGLQYLNRRFAVRFANRRFHGRPDSQNFGAPKHFHLDFCAGNVELIELPGKLPY